MNNKTYTLLNKLKSRIAQHHQISETTCYLCGDISSEHCEKSGDFSLLKEIDEIIENTCPHCFSSLQQTLLSPPDKGYVVGCARCTYYEYKL